MTTVRSAIENTVSISQFNRGQAGKIFDDVKQTGAKVVMKNNMPECVLLSPQDYVQLLDALEDAQLQLLAMERLKNFDPAKTIPWEDVKRELGLDELDPDEIEDVEFE
ncbi:MAG: type II toxin-antitoxin system Phd/YefM family antitoxin [Peptococcaceae bacterium]|nr:type II toxin-antitoxin system Phd/YefM family antitoxin [Peptococcaceae bacterium]